MVLAMSSEDHLVDRWRALLTSYNEIACRLDRELHAAYGIGMSEFETLDRLVAQDSDQCRMQELASDIYLSQSALSRTVARLEKAGLVVRTMCELDRRGVFVKVTDEGTELHAAGAEIRQAILADMLAKQETPA